MSSCCRRDSAGLGVFIPKRRWPTRPGAIAILGLLLGAALCLSLARPANSGRPNVAVPSQPKPDTDASYRAPWWTPDVTGENSVQYCQHSTPAAANPRPAIFAAAAFQARQRGLS